eukprot:1195574-Prorocentrum_minimum.AAC.4
MRLNVRETILVLVNNAAKPIGRTAFVLGLTFARVKLRKYRRTQSLCAVASVPIIGRDSLLGLPVRGNILSTRLLACLTFLPKTSEIQVCRVVMPLAKVHGVAAASQSPSFPPSLRFPLLT